MPAISTPARFWSKVQKGGSDDCWPYVGATSCGYGHVSFQRKTWRAHRLAFALTHGGIPKNEAQHHGTVIMHTCDNRRCCNPAHLVAATQGENLADMRAKGREGYHGLPGSRNSNASVTQEHVRSIEALRESGLSARKIGGKVGLSTTTVAMIIRGEHWAAQALARAKVQP